MAKYIVLTERYGELTDRITTKGGTTYPSLKAAEKAAARLLKRRASAGHMLSKLVVAKVEAQTTPSLVWK